MLLMMMYADHHNMYLTGHMNGLWKNPTSICDKNEKSPGESRNTENIATQQGNLQQSHRGEKKQSISQPPNKAVLSGIIYTLALKEKRLFEKLRKRKETKKGCRPPSQRVETKGTGKTIATCPYTSY